MIYFLQIVVLITASVLIFTLLNRFFKYLNYKREALGLKTYYDIKEYLVYMLIINNVPNFLLEFYLNKEYKRSALWSLEHNDCGIETYFKLKKCLTFDIISKMRKNGLPPDTLMDIFIFDWNMLKMKFDTDDKSIEIILEKLTPKLVNKLIKYHNRDKSSDELKRVLQQEYITRMKNEIERNNKEIKNVQGVNIEKYKSLISDNAELQDSINELSWSLYPETIPESVKKEREESYIALKELIVNAERDIEKGVI